MFYCVTPGLVLLVLKLSPKIVNVDSLGQKPFVVLINHGTVERNVLKPYPVASISVLVYVTIPVLANHVPKRAVNDVYVERSPKRGVVQRKVGNVDRFVAKALIAACIFVTEYVMKGLLVVRAIWACPEVVPVASKRQPLIVQNKLKAVEILV